MFSSLKPNFHGICMHLEGAIQAILGVDGGYITVSQNVKWGREEVVRLSDIFTNF